MSPAKEYIADICINEVTDTWKSVVLTQTSSIRYVLRKLKDSGVKAVGHFLTTENNVPVSICNQLLCFQLLITAEVG